MGRYKEFVLVSVEDAGRLGKQISKADEKYFFNDGRFNSAELRRLNQLQAAIDFMEKHPEAADSKRIAKNISEIFFIVDSKDKSRQPMASSQQPQQQQEQQQQEQQQEEPVEPSRSELFAKSGSFVAKALRDFATDYKSQYKRAAAIIDYMQDNPHKYKIDLSTGAWMGQKSKMTLLGFYWSSPKPTELASRGWIHPT